MGKHLKKEEESRWTGYFGVIPPAVFNRAGELLEPVKKGTVILRQMPFFRSSMIRLLQCRRKMAVAAWATVTELS